MSDAPNCQPTQHADLTALAVANEVRTQLATIMVMLQANKDAMEAHQKSTHQRIDDMKEAIGTRIDDHGRRIKTLEGNERSTALKVSGIGALAGTASAVLVQAAMNALTGGRH